MLKERLNALKSKGYDIQKISITTVVSDPESIEGLLYFSKPIYKKNKGFSKKYTPTRVPAEHPSSNISRVETRLEIEFSINLTKINNLKALLKKITNEIIPLLKIDCYKKDYYTTGIFSKAHLYTKKNSKENPVIITLHLGTLNFQRELESNSNLSVEGTISIIKGKYITRYF
jgi:hypothetical protein